MYRVREAAARVGISVPLLRAWERRYGVVRPARTPAGYRLYDDAAIERLRTMRRLVDGGWSPSTAAQSLHEGRIPDAVGTDAVGSAGDAELVDRFVLAARALDTSAIEATLDEMFARGSFETITTRHLLPALRALGAAWSVGRIDVAAEHAASGAVLRRLAMAFDAAARPSDERPVLVGLPPGSRHELGALAFATAARRAGLPIVYLGPDLPLEDWLAAAERSTPSAAVIGVLMAEDATDATRVAQGLVHAVGDLQVALGGPFAEAAHGRLDAASRGRALVLPDDLSASVHTLVEAVRGR